MSAELPINAVLQDLRGALSVRGAAVLIAPPGAGKTTAVAPALLDEDWCDGEIIITSPRRVAARAAAERMAQVLGENVGETVGYQTRMDSKVSNRTRIKVVTEAILVNRLVSDPELPGVSAILFDEAHERHLDSDLGLALALETRAVLRDDLRVLVMSATIDGARFGSLLGPDAAVIESEGRSFPLSIEWLGSDPTRPLEDHVSAAVLTAWREEEGDILTFLPGVREIERVRERLSARLPDTPVLPLHGQVEPPAQRAAIRRDPDGRRRIVLATSIAETSLTLDGVSIVVDCGLARVAEFDRTAGTTRLVTVRASQAAATQRAGRAARQGSGTAYRLWEEAGHYGRPEFATPEIESADLSGLILDLARWGSGDPTDLAWLDPPPAASVQTARGSLKRMGAVDENGRITPFGEAIASLPMAPHEGAALLHAVSADAADEAAQLIMTGQERGLGGRSEDLAQRLGSWRGERSKRAENARRIAKGWAGRAEKLDATFETAAQSASDALALARPDFVARKRDAKGEHWISAGGRGFVLDPASPLAGAEWMVVLDAQGAAKGARITSGVELMASDIERLFAEELKQRSTARWNKDKGRVEARRERRLGAISLTSTPDPKPDPQTVGKVLLEAAKGSLEQLLPAGFLERARFAEIDQLSIEALENSAATWLWPVIDGRRDLDIPPNRIAEAAVNLIDWSVRKAFDERAPTHFMSPAGTRHVIDYAGDDAPSVEVRVQALFGLDQHPMIGKTSLLLKLTSPAGRPIQSTRDLSGFWRGTWADVAKDMKGRYPKHRWPEQPWLEKPSLKTKNAFNRS